MFQLTLIIALLLLLIATVCDLRTREIPNWISIAIALVAIVTSSVGWLGLGFPLVIAGGALGFLVGYSLFRFAQLGGGDAKLIAALGLLSKVRPSDRIIWHGNRGRCSVTQCDMAQRERYRVRTSNCCWIHLVYWIFFSDLSRSQQVGDAGKEFKTKSGLQFSCHGVRPLRTKAHNSREIQATFSTYIRIMNQYHRKQRSGQALIEFALVALVLYLIVGAAATFVGSTPQVKFNRQPMLGRGNCHRHRFRLTLPLRVR